jgi:phosphatidylglycerol:prolipoprotein diacylglycerol transferase
MQQLRHGVLLGFELEHDGEGPPQVRAVEPASKAESAGLRTGAQIDHINGEPVRSTQQAERALLAAFGQENLELATSDGTRLSWPVGNRPAFCRPIHPAQVYAAIDAGILCLFLLALSGFLHRTGALLTVGLSLHAVSRFLLEMIRTDEPGVVFGLSPGQAISLLLIAASGGLWWFFVRRQSAAAP